MRAGLALAATTLVASPAFAANEEWPDGPNKEFFRGLQRPDASPRASEFERSCCGPGDVVKTKSSSLHQTGRRPIARARPKPRASHDLLSSAASSWCRSRRRIVPGCGRAATTATCAARRTAMSRRARPRWRRSPLQDAVTHDGIKLQVG